MKFHKKIKGQGFENTCGNCSYFQNDPGFIEKKFAGLQILSSGYGSVRGSDGICCHHQLYLPADDCCSDFMSKTSITREIQPNT